VIIEPSLLTAGAVSVNSVGALSSHIVCEPVIFPGSKLLTVIFIVSVLAMHLLVPIVDVTSLKYHVSCASIPGLYVSLIAVGIGGPKVEPSILLNHL